jgi:3-deoxy-D-manno-octulosonate 8-phosphate phosphatase (KDO 8-P phosphatase)
MEDFKIEYDLSNAKTLKNVLSYFRNITTFVFDVDGVMTDGTLVVTEGGDSLRTFSVRDGYALRRAVEEGYNICVITGGKGGSIENRMKNLGIKHYYTGASDKVTPFLNYVRTHNIDPMQVLYMGDDLNDLLVMQKVGLPCCPLDACPDIQDISHYISPIKGGAGCVRDVIEKVMKLQDTWMNSTSVSS